MQRVIEKPLEKKAGRNFGPPGTRRLIYFVDDMNMPEVSTELAKINSVSFRFENISLKKASK